MSLLAVLIFSAASFAEPSLSHKQSCFADLFNKTVSTKVPNLKVAEASVSFSKSQGISDEDEYEDVSFTAADEKAGAVYHGTTRIFIQPVSEIYGGLEAGLAGLVGIQVECSYEAGDTAVPFIQIEGIFSSGDLKPEETDEFIATNGHG